MLEYLVKKHLNMCMLVNEHTNNSIKLQYSFTHDRKLIVDQ